ncbi:hypothetical protein OIU77_010403 [Salix suchowensis]|uniref:WRKY domain-containing protein n=1 Tax=Salix suchowensis TaxID=1278906 RepID=A0ABQ9A9A0_9ROSI|nr:hypothetical protein OIU77_010403 [Salix suchowensis]
MEGQGAPPPPPPLPPPPLPQFPCQNSPYLFTPSLLLPGLGQNRPIMDNASMVAENGAEEEKGKKKGGRMKKATRPRFAFQTRSADDILDDGYRWRKYGQKAVKNSKYPRFAIN